MAEGLPVEDFIPLSYENHRTWDIAFLDYGQSRSSLICRVFSQQTDSLLSLRAVMRDIS
jgi:hypothetical protein